MANDKTLLALPTELVEHILRELPPWDLFDAMLICSQIKNIAEPLLYQDVTIRSSIKQKCFARIISSTPQKATRVLKYTLKIPEPSNGLSHGNGMHGLEITAQGKKDALVIGCLSNLQHLRIKSPWAYWNLSQLFADSRHQPSRISSRLKTLHIDLCPSSYHVRKYNFSDTFILPQLEALTLCNMDIEFLLENTLASSPALKTLCIIDCDTSSPFTNASMLEHLISSTPLIENVEIRKTNATPRFGAYRPDTIQEWIVAMDSAKHSIKRLVLEDYPRRKPSLTTSTVRLGEFTAVKHLEICFRDILGDGYEEHHLHRIFPLNLETLTFLSRGYVSYSLKDWERLSTILRDEVCLPNLKKIAVENSTGYKCPPYLVAACENRGIELLEDALNLLTFRG